MSEVSSSKVSTSGLTLTYGAAAFSAVTALLLTLAVLSQLFGLWTNSALTTLVILSGYTGIVTTAIAAVLFAVAALLLYRRATKDIGAQPAYLNTSAYHFITNALVGVLAFLFVTAAAGVVSVLISSLLLIGSGTDIGALYLGQFLPGLLGAGLIGVLAYTAYKIMKGKNLSSLMNLVLVSVAGAALLAVLITVPIKAHDSTTSTTKSYDYNRSYYNLGN